MVMIRVIILRMQDRVDRLRMARIFDVSMCISFEVARRDPIYYEPALLAR